MPVRWHDYPAGLSFTYVGGRMCDPLSAIMTHANQEAMLLQTRACRVAVWCQVLIRRMILLIHEHGMFLHLFVSSLISFTEFYSFLYIFFVSLGQM